MNEGRPSRTRRGIVAIHPARSSRARAEVSLTLRLLETTDVHGWLLGYDYYTDQPSSGGSLSRLATLIERARAEAPNCLLFDNGDFLQGTPMAEFWARKLGLRPGEVHPVIAAMNALGYDAATLGNHEFNYGLRFLTRALAGASFPLVSANAVIGRAPDPAQDRLLLPPWRVLTRQLRDTEGQLHELRIGVIGFLPWQTADWDRSVLGDGLFSRGVLAAARAHLPALRAQGVDLVVALAHTGIDPPGPGMTGSDLDENVAVPLAALEGIDVVLGGHNHLTFPGPEIAATEVVDPIRGTLHGKPAVVAGRWGSHLGVIDLQLSRTARGWRIADHRSALWPASLRRTAEAPTPIAEEHPRIVAVTASAHAETLAHIRSPVGRLDTPIHSFLSMIAPDAGLSLIAAAQTDHVRTRLEGRPEADLPVLSAVAPFKCGGRGGPDYFIDIAPGAFSRAQVADLYVFPNTIAALVISGAELALWLERSAGLFHQITPGLADQPLIDAAVPCYNFDVVFGVTYEIDPSQPAAFGHDGSPAATPGQRIRNLCHQGRPVRPEDRFVIATNNYRAAGAGRFAGTHRPELDLGPRVSSQDMLAAYVAAQGTVAPLPEPVWRFAALPDTSAVFETSCRVLRLIPQMTGGQLAPLGRTVTGFQEIRLRFRPRAARLPPKDWASPRDQRNFCAD